MVVSVCDYEAHCSHNFDKEGIAILMRFVADMCGHRSSGALYEQWGTRINCKNRLARKADTAQTHERPRGTLTLQERSLSKGEFNGHT